MSEQWKTNDEEGQMPLGTRADGIEGVSEGGFGEEKKATVSVMTVVLVGIFAAGLGMIYLMGLQNRPQRASAAQSATEAQVEASIAELVGKGVKREDFKQMFKDTDQLVQMFYNYPGGAVTEEELSGNPFVHNGASSTTEIRSVAPLSNVSTAEQERVRRAAEQFAGLKLQTIIVSNAMKAAMINGRLVTVGAKVEEFVVEEIEPKRVVLRWGKEHFELRLARPGMEGK